MAVFVDYVAILKFNEKYFKQQSTLSIFFSFSKKLSIKRDF